MLLHDPLTARGTQANRRKWKPVEAQGLIIGYLNVPPTREQEFERALATFQRRNQYPDVLRALLVFAPSRFNLTV